MREKIAQALMRAQEERELPVDPDWCWEAADHVVGALVAELTDTDVSVRHARDVISPGLLTFTERESGHTASLVVG